MTEVGLFPLGIVLLPTERVPLHIFEERYQELIGECLAGGEELGIVYSEGEGVSEIGTRAVVVDVLQRFDDGRLHILVEGRGRFRLLEVTSGRSFHTGLVEPVEDEEDAASTETAERALELFVQLRDLAESDVDVPPAEAEQLSYVLAGRVELATEAKLELLAESSERARLRRVCELFEVTLALLERRQRASERAVTNGRVEAG